MPSEKRKKPKPTESYKADYQGATPKQVAQAMLKYRPVQGKASPPGKAGNPGGKNKQRRNVTDKEHAHA